MSEDGSKWKDSNKELSKLRIVRFEANPRICIGCTKKASVEWEVEGASALRLLAGGEEKSIDFKAGSLEIDVRRSMDLVLRAKDPDGIEVSACTTVKIVPSMLYWAVVSLVLCTIGFVWMISESLIMTADLVENCPLTQWPQRLSRLVALGSTILGAPIVASMFRSLGHQSYDGLGVKLLVNPFARFFVVLACFVVLFVSAFASAKVERVMVSSEVEGTVHLWKNLKNSSKKVALSVPSGISETLFCPLKKETDSIPVSSFADSFTPDKVVPEWDGELLRLGCRAKIEIKLPDKFNSGKSMVEWSGGGVSILGANGTAEKAVPDCSSFPTYATLRVFDDENRQRLRWKFELTESAFTAGALKPLEIGSIGVAIKDCQKHGDQEILLSTGQGDSWLATAISDSTKTDENCALTILVPTTVSREIKLCARALGNDALESVDSECVPGEKGWRSRIALNLQDKDLKKNPMMAEFSWCHLCISPVFSPEDTLLLTSQNKSFDWKTGEGHLASILWPNYIGESVPPTSLEKDGQIRDIKLEKKSDGEDCLFKDHVLPNLDTGSIHARKTGGGLLGLIQKGQADLEMESFPDKEICNWLSDTEFETTDGRVEFKGLPEWAKKKTTQWRIVHKLTGVKYICDLGYKNRAWSFTCAEETNE